MSSILRFLVGVLVLATATGATVWWRTRAAVPPEADYPQQLDLGPQKFQEIVHGHFRVANTGGSPLELSRFFTSCSCAGVEVLDGGRWRGVTAVRLSPGESADLRVRISIAAHPGTSQTVSVRFDTNDPKRAKAHVEVVIPRVTSDAYTDPAALIFGDVRIGDPAQRTVTVYDCGIPGRRITRVASQHPERFEVRLAPPGTPLLRIDHPYAGQPIGQVLVTARTDRSGKLDSELEIEWEDSQPSVRRIRITGEVLAPVAVTPSILFLPRIVSGQTMHTGTVRLASRDGLPITASIRDVPDGLTATIVEHDGNTAVVSVRCRELATPSTAPPRRGMIRVEVATAKSKSVVEIPICFP